MMAFYRVCILAVPSLLRQPLRALQHYSSQNNGSQTPRPLAIDYDLDKLMENVRVADNKSEQVPPVTRRPSPLTIEEIVEFLKHEKSEDICVISIPPEMDYVRYFVTCSGIGSRHIQRVADNLASECKRTRDSEGQRRKVWVEGRDSEQWAVVDLGDTVVHVMSPEARSLYQLELLWTLGHEYDNQYRSMELVNIESEQLK